MKICTQNYELITCRWFVLVSLKTLILIQTLQLITWRIVEKMAPCSNCKCSFSLITELSCLFSSQVPPPSDFEVWGALLKFAEVHQAFCRHDWLHQIRLGDPNRFTTKPLSCLFVKVVKYADRERADDSTSVRKTAQSTIIPPKRKKICVSPSPIAKNSRFRMSPFSVLPDVFRDGPIAYRISIGRLQRNLCKQLYSYAWQKTLYTTVK